MGRTPSRCGTPTDRARAWVRFGRRRRVRPHPVRRRPVTWRARRATCPPGRMFVLLPIAHLNTAAPAPEGVPRAVARKKTSRHGLEVFDLRHAPPELLFQAHEDRLDAARTARAGAAQPDLDDAVI